MPTRQRWRLLNVLGRVLGLAWTTWTGFWLLAHVAILSLGKPWPEVRTALLWELLLLAVLFGLGVLYLRAEPYRPDLPKDPREKNGKLRSWWTGDPKGVKA
jgi:hypothetical protein